jgi:hypothetical protein
MVSISARPGLASVEGAGMFERRLLWDDVDVQVELVGQGLAVRASGVDYR